MTTKQNYDYMKRKLNERNDDRIRHDDVETGYTEKQAYQSLYDYCKYKNNL